MLKQFCNIFSGLLQHFFHYGWPLVVALAVAMADKTSLKPEYEWYCIGRMYVLHQQWVCHYSPAIQW